MKQLLSLPTRVVSILKRIKWVFSKLEYVTDQIEALTRQVRQNQAQTAQQLASLHYQLDRLRTLNGLTSQSIQALARQQAALPGAQLAARPLVSVVLPSWNRAEVIETALRSLQQQSYEHWEALIVDDGSLDGTGDRIAHFLADPRFRYFCRPHEGVSAARNFGLAESRGEIIAYLDSDNAWFPKYLETLVAAFAEDADLQSAYTAQVIELREESVSYMRGEDFDPERLRSENFIDLNVFAHRRSLYERLGGFDTQMDRIVDWDLIARYTDTDRTRYLPFIGGLYSMGRADQITVTRNMQHNLHRMRSKRAASEPRKPLKVLYTLWHYPQLSESYIRTEIAAALKLGVEVEVWAEEKGIAPFSSEAPVHYGSLLETIERFKPVIIHTHWLDYGERFGKQLEQTGLPVTVRGHGFEFEHELIERLNRAKNIAGIYLFPHFVRRCDLSSGKIKAVPVAFNPDRYYPQTDKDRRLVLRTACALKTKDLDGYLRMARMCANHRFLLVLCRGHKVEWILDEIVETNRKLGNPVEIRVDLQHEELAELMRRTGIYLHTAGGDQPFGMPISIAEAMASGCYLVGRNRPGGSEYIGEAGRLYDTAEEAAALVRETEGWSEREWNNAFVKSVDRAYAHFVSDKVIEPIVADWRRIAGQDVH
jgi:glycosyltransferase involved in cell wall biosynthesis